MKLEEYMRKAIKEAEESLREGNNGFGAVIVKDGEIISSAHDREDTENDPTSHAEVNAIRAACEKLGKNLTGCILISTHEPCPMCAFAIAWSCIGEIAYGYSINDSIGQGRKRIAFPCKEAFHRAGIDVTVHEGILKEECSILYRRDVRKEIENLRYVSEQSLKILNEDSTVRRKKWFHENRSDFDIDSKDLLNSGYQLLLKRFGITAAEAPIVNKTDSQITFHSMNFCPTLQACRILGLDTRFICKRLNEASTDTLLKQIDSNLCFARNYDKLRPYTEYCEEMICIIK